MTETLFILLSLLVSLFVVFPIFQEKKSNKRGRAAHSTNNHAVELAEQKRNIYKAIKEIEFDFEMGKLSQDDFEELRQQYKDDAVGLLKKIDQAGAPGSRKKKRKAVRDGSGSTNSGESVKFCWVCGTGATADDKFCASCGTDLQATDRG